MSTAILDRLRTTVEDTDHPKSAIVFSAVQRSEWRFKPPAPLRLISDRRSNSPLRFHGTHERAGMGGDSRDLARSW